MFEQTNFTIKQLQRTEAAMGQPALSEFRPDGRTAADVHSMLSHLESTKTAQIDASTELNASRGTLDGLWAEAHGMCVDAYGAMRSVYRNDSDALYLIRRIPKQDQTPQQTLDRMSSTASVWADLPDMPNTNPPQPFKVGSLTLGVFNGKLAELRTQIATCETCESDFELKQRALTQLTAKDGDFVSAAVAQGRTQYPVGSPGRDAIDTIPLEQGQNPPAQAVITSATSPAPGVVRLTFSATHATSYTIQHRLESDVEFVTVADDVTDESWEFVGLPAGDHQYIVFGVNSRGSGPVSEIATVPVAAQAAA